MAPLRIKEDITARSIENQNFSAVLIAPLGPGALFDDPLAVLVLLLFVLPALPAVEDFSVPFHCLDGPWMVGDVT